MTLILHCIKVKSNGFKLEDMFEAKKDKNKLIIKIKSLSKITKKIMLKNMFKIKMIKITPI